MRGASRFPVADIVFFDHDGGGGGGRNTKESKYPGLMSLEPQVELGI